MGIKEINATRANMGLDPIVVDPIAKARAAKRRAANLAARGQASRDLKMKRSSGKK